MLGSEFLEIVAKRAAISVRLRLGLLKLKLERRAQLSNSEGGFFDSYPRFFSTSTTAASPYRLNQRYRALIGVNESVIRGKSVLDIASHDGRWSMAAHKAGARHVLGIEARPSLVEAARANMREYQVSEDRVSFVLGDVFQEIDRLQPDTFDTIFCFGFLYHTLHHMQLLSQISRLRPKHVIVDTYIYLDPLPVIKVVREEVEAESAGAVPDVGDPTGCLIGWPTKSALELMLSNSGFTVSHYDWHRAGIKNWNGLEAYYLGRRITLLATRRPPPG